MAKEYFSITKNKEKRRSKFAEIDVISAEHVALPPQIAWGQDRLKFEKIWNYSVNTPDDGVDNIPLYALYLTQKKGTRNTETDLSTLFTSAAKPIFFTGTKEGMYSYDPLTVGQYYPPLYIIGLPADSLQKDMRGLSPLWRQIGHIMTLHREEDIRLLRAAIFDKDKYLPDCNLAEFYAFKLTTQLEHTSFSLEITREELVNLMEKNEGFKNEMTNFYRIRAQAYANKIKKQYSLPTGFK